MFWSPLQALFATTRVRGGGEIITSVRTRPKQSTRETYETNKAASLCNMTLNIHDEGMREAVFKAA